MEVWFFRMREDRRKHYDDGFRREALRLIEAGVGKRSLARRFAMPVQTAEKWIMLYRSNGGEAVMGTTGNRRYGWETKVAAARHIIKAQAAMRREFHKGIRPPVRRFAESGFACEDRSLRPLA